MGGILLPNNLITVNRGFRVYCARNGIDGYFLQEEHLAIVVVGYLESEEITSACETENNTQEIIA